MTNSKHFAGTQLWIWITAIACALFIGSRLADASFLIIASKTAASGGFLMVALSCNATGSRYGKILLAGLLFAAVGDMFLLGGEHWYFLMGLTSFLLAHILYISAFFQRGINFRWAASAAVPVALLSFAASAWLSPFIDESMLLPVRAYTAVISVMVIAAIGTRGKGNTVFIPIGASMFYLSDLSVAIGQFVPVDFPNFVWGLPLYYGGQLLLALSITPERRPIATG